jgi:hypothetical protein
VDNIDINDYIANGDNIDISDLDIENGSYHFLYIGEKESNEPEKTCLKGVIKKKRFDYESLTCFCLEL